MKTTTIAVLGAGSWGTAVAIHMASVGFRVMLWGHTPQHVSEMIEQRSNNTIYQTSLFHHLLRLQLI